MSKNSRATPPRSLKAVKRWEPGKGEKYALWARLRKCAESMAKSEPLSSKDGVWIADILMKLSRGDDVRPICSDPPRRGPRTKSNDGEFWIAVEALILSAETNVKGKALWGKLADKWGYPDGTIKNFISRNRQVASELVDDMGRNELKALLPGYLAENNNSRN